MILNVVRFKVTKKKSTLNLSVCKKKFENLQKNARCGPECVLEELVMN